VTAPPDHPETPGAAPGMSTDGPAYDIFLSDNSQDRPHVLAVRQRLREWGLAAFFDREGLIPSPIETFLAEETTIRIPVG
jgi:hypothetical protein